MKRYFIVFYVASSKKGQITGNSALTSYGYIKRDAVTREIERLTNSYDLSFTNIIEITKEDYDHYTKE